MSSEEPELETDLHRMWEIWLIAAIFVAALAFGVKAVIEMM